MPPRPQRTKGRTPSPAPPHDRADESKVCGVNACHALVAQRIDDVIRVYLTEERVKSFGRLLKWCAEQRKAYHVVTDEELGRVAATMHHEGICILAREKEPRTLDELLLALKQETGPVCLIGLEDVQNPHNVGAIVRVCAHFGVRALLALRGTPVDPSTAMLRTAEGGAEHVEVVALRSPRADFASLRKAGFKIYATSQHAKADLWSQPLSGRAVFLFGSESFGLSKELVAISDGVVRIGGTGCVESLNVACAATALLSEYWRQHRASSR